MVVSSKIKLQWAIKLQSTPLGRWHITVFGGIRLLSVLWSTAHVATYTLNQRPSAWRFRTCLRSTSAINKRYTKSVLLPARTTRGQLDETLCVVLTFSLCPNKSYLAPRWYLGCPCSLPSFYRHCQSSSHRSPGALLPSTPAFLHFLEPQIQGRMFK